jgi:sporulation-control protein spo0M
LNNRIEREALFETFINNLEAPSANDLLKYVHDSTFYEVIKKGESSTAQIPMNEIQQWSNTNKFQLHPTKSKELCISFTHTKRHHTPVTIGNNSVELVKSIKILGVTVDTSIKKAAKRLYFFG